MSSDADLLRCWCSEVPPPASLVPEIQRAAIGAIIFANSSDGLEVHVPPLETASATDWLQAASDLLGVTMMVDRAEDLIATCLWLADEIPWAKLMLVVHAAKHSAKSSIARRVAEALELKTFDPAHVVPALGAANLVLPRARKSGASVKPRSVSSESAGHWIRVVADDIDIKQKYRALRRSHRLVGVSDLAVATATLRIEFPWLGNVIDAVTAELRLAEACGRPYVTVRPILLYGSPGAGKSRFARRFLQIMQIPFVTIIAGGSSDNRHLAGTSEGWANANPSLPVKVILTHQVGNPGLLIEEIDKAGGSGLNGHIADTLLTMTDPEVSPHWYDECVGAPVNLSKVNWIMTANRLDLVPPALRARFMAVEVKAPGITDFHPLLAAIQDDLAKEFDVHPMMLPALSTEAVELMRREFWRGSLTARQLTALVRRAMAAAADEKRLAS
ncbi:AAA family ATPase [Nitrospirillum pindoramense]|uniref:ATPase family protein associated with various cellular activities (AAA) n=1 Tax=Nitrospirillum amazonense TaxID=28077 RepID=A0A560H8D1_9PROT|nr:AAA family ATPase [Nitrospirillum amazonense]TWB42597.1 ATPase family protein associated with various cellular activities (AAA) [Nitrospirillum amazonense]